MRRRVTMGWGCRSESALALQQEERCSCQFSLQIIIDVVPPDKAQAHRLGSRIVDALEAALKQRLNNVTYRCLKGEMDEDRLRDPALYIGGEVVLELEHRTLTVSWDENAGWTDHFSLYVGQRSLFRPDADLESWNASELCAWAPCLGKELTEAIVLGRNSTPHILSLVFESERVLIGDGFEERFGDGDDVLIRGSLGPEGCSEFTELWSSRGTVA